MTTAACLNWDAESERESGERSDGDIKSDRKLFSEDINRTSIFPDSPLPIFCSHCKRSYRLITFLPTDLAFFFFCFDLLWRKQFLPRQQAKIDVFCQVEMLPFQFLFSYTITQLELQSSQWRRKFVKNKFKMYECVSREMKFICEFAAVLLSEMCSKLIKFLQTITKAAITQVHQFFTSIPGWRWHS